MSHNLRSPQPFPRTQFPYLLLLFSFAAVAGIYFLISATFSRHLVQAVVDVTQLGNTSLTQVFVNDLYPRLVDELGFSANPQEMKQGLDEAELARVDREVRRFMLGTDILKVKLYNIGGTTLYSSDADQVGEIKADTPGFRSAAVGIPISEMSFRNEFSAFEGKLFQRDLVSSYLPINDGNGVVIGVAEIYTDRTSALEHARDLHLQMQAQLIPLLAALLLLLAIIIWRFSYQITQVRVQMLEQDLD